MDIAPIIIAYFIPLGITLIAWGSWSDERIRRQAVTAVWVMALAVLAYAAIGFAFNFGGLGLRPDVPGGLRGLDRMWSPLGGAAGRSWGVIGVEGYLLNAASTLPGDLALLFTQFLHQLPLVMAAVLIPALALADRTRLLTISIVATITAGILVPILNAWAWGGGWLFMLGSDAKFGHGFIDPAGAATTLTAASFITLAALLALGVRRAPDQALDGSPLKSIFGVIIFVIGWLAWLTTDPILQVNRSIDLALAATNLLLSGAASAAIATAYGWFTTGRPDAALAARGMMSGLIAATAGAAFVPAWAALVIGAVAGLWMPISMHAIERWLKLDDASGFVAMTGSAGLWSMLAAGLLADGTYGAGWNGIGVAEYLGVSGQGITGLFAAANLQNDPGQMSAQLTGALAVVAAAFIVTWLVLRPFRRAHD
jgi:ammonium transporter, Amt family